MNKWRDTSTCREDFSWGSCMEEKWSCCMVSDMLLRHGEREFVPVWNVRESIGEGIEVFVRTEGLIMSLREDAMMMDSLYNTFLPPPQKISYFLGRMSRMCE